MKDPTPQPRRRDAAVILAMMLVAATLWFTILGPLGGSAGWQTLFVIAAILLLIRLADRPIKRLSRWVSGKGKR